MEFTGCFDLHFSDRFTRNFNQYSVCLISISDYVFHRTTKNHFGKLKDRSTANSKQWLRSLSPMYWISFVWKLDILQRMYELISSFFTVIRQFLNKISPWILHPRELQILPCTAFHKLFNCLKSNRVVSYMLLSVRKALWQNNKQNVSNDASNEPLNKPVMTVASFVFIKRAVFFFYHRREFILA